MTSFDLLGIIREVQPKIANSHLVNVYQASPNLLILKLRTKEAENQQLLLEAARRIHLTSTRYKTPRILPPFCSTLRKHLRNGILTGISQRDLDRVAILDIKNGPFLYKLIVELLDRGNIVLTDSSLTIIATNVRKEKTTRPIEKGALYVFPKIRGLDLQEATAEEVFNLFQKSKSDTVRSLVQFLNLPGEVAEEICIRAGISKATPADALTIDEVRSLLTQARLLVKEIGEEPLQPLLVRKESTLVSVVPRKLRAFSLSEVTEFGSFSDALEQYFREANQISRSQRESEAKAKWEYVIADQTKTAEKLTQDAKQLREQGALIFAHLREVERLLATLIEAKRNLGDWRRALQSIQELNINSPQLQPRLIDPKTGNLSISVSDSLLELDASKSAAANASEYYQRAKDSEGKAKRALDAVNESKRKLEATSLEVRKRRVEEKKTLTRQFWYERFRWFISSEGCLAVGGRDAAQNDTLIKKYLEPHDVVVHADVHGAPFAIIKRDETPIGEASIEEAAQFAVCYSSAWKGGLGNADAYWVKPDQVSKSAPSGEYLGKGAFMIRGEKNFHRGISLHLAIGVQVDEETQRIVAGPPSAVRSHAKVSVEIIPGDIPPEKIAPQIRYRLAHLLSDEASEEIKRLDDSEFIRFLPQGGSRFVQDNS